MKRDRFLRLWPLKGRGRSTTIRLRLKPASLKSGQISSTPTDADLAQRVMALKKTTPSGFTVVAQPPFMVIGDEPPDLVRRRARGTVKWAVDRLRQDFFVKDPKKIIDIWLFKNHRSYSKGSRRIAGHTPHTPYGYYSEEHNAMIMNIATGGGTLVHEIVHPFMSANFPDCPAWYNEGLGSLFEQSADRNGRIVGLTNWRLRGLQEAIRAGAVPSFRWLLSTSEEVFYERDPGTNYAQARYLCLYLQNRGLLVRFHREFMKNHRSDPTGYRTLKRVLQVNDMTAFKQYWEKWVTALRYP